MTVRTRFAPSPTGSLHVGGARTALYCLLHARRHDGRFLLRIEDTDRARSTDEAAAGILRDLHWLGLQWDEGPEVGGDTGPYYQSQRLDTYQPYFDQLVEQDLAYEAWETPAELRQMRDEAAADKRNFRYRRIPYTDEDIARFQAEGRTPVLRLTAPSEPTHVHDDILGTVTTAAEDLADIVIRKADGFPTYHFGVVIDDHLMGVTQVLRGQEHLLNTPKHLGLYAALGWDAPRYGHMPLIFNPGGSKMSKRDKAKAARAALRAATKARSRDHDHGPHDHAWILEHLQGVDADDLRRFMKKKHDGVALAEAIARHLGEDLPKIEVMDFRRAGYLPEALLNYLALLGWSPGDDLEIMTLDQMVEHFDLGDVGHTAAKFDPAKLEWMNGEYIRQSSLDRLMAALDDYLTLNPDTPLAREPEARRRRFLEVYQPRIHTFDHLVEQTAFYFDRPTTWDAKAAKKHLLKGQQPGLDRLTPLAEAVAAIDDFSAEGIEAALAAFAEAHALRMGKVAQPIRVAVTGAGVSPGIGETLELLGREEATHRLAACHEHFHEPTDA